MRYAVKVSNPQGVAQLMLDAADEADVIAQARSLGYVTLAIRSESAWGNLAARWQSGFPLVLFSQGLLILLEAGLSLVEAIETLREKEHRAEVRQVIEGVIAALYDGQPFSQALQKFPAAFPALYVAAIKASEKTSNINEALSRYLGYEAKIGVVRKKIVSASIYPVLLLVVGGLVILFLLGYVVPKFSHIYEEAGGDLPLMSRWLMQWGQLLEAHGSTVLGAGLAGMLLCGYALMQPVTRQWMVRQVWQLPSVGERVRVFHLARFYRMLGMLLRGGIPVANALQMVSSMLPASLRVSLDAAEREIRQGRSISLAMEQCGLTTPVALRMLRVGERTGRMGDMMESIAVFYDEEMAQWVEWFTRLFEPILMAFIGVMIGLIVVLMYFPIFELAGSIQ